MMGLSGVDIVVGASGVSAVIGAGYLVHRAIKSIRAWGAQTWDRLERLFSHAVDNSTTGHLVKYHLGPNGTTRPMHERVGSIEQAQADHNTVAAAIGNKVAEHDRLGTTRHQENTRKLMDISARLVAVEKAQKTAAALAEDTEARHQGDT
jgi:hypothetical protein